MIRLWMERHSKFNLFFYLSLPYFDFQSEKLNSELTSLLDIYFNIQYNSSQ